MKMNNKLYDILKWLSLVVFNAIGVLYKTIAAVWNLPFGEQVMTTCAAIALFIGALIGISTAEFNKTKVQPFVWHDHEIEDKDE
jgi:hypothetical protein